MKILILYASAGSGHFKAALALYNFFKKEKQEIELELVDALDYANSIYRITYAYGYLFLVKYASLIWRLGFFLTNKRPLCRFIQPLFLAINRQNLKKFSRLLIKEKADFIISTHFLPSEIAANLKNNRKIDAKLITVITDFGVHPFWVLPGTDIYIAASGFTREKLISYGIPQEQIRESGIPIEPKFLVNYKRQELFDKFHTKADKFTVLIVTGSFGTGPIEKIVEALHKEAQLLVVCARNARLYQKLKKINYPGTLVFGFIDNIQELMAISDIIITKPGGLSISESIIMGKPAIFIAPIPGQETENIKALSSYGIGIFPRGIMELKRIVMELKLKPALLRQKNDLISRLKKPNAAGEILDVVCQSSSGACGRRPV